MGQRRERETSKDAQGDFCSEVPKSAELCRWAGFPVLLESMPFRKPVGPGGGPPWEAGLAAEVAWGPTEDTAGQQGAGGSEGSEEQVSMLCPGDSLTQGTLVYSLQPRENQTHKPPSPALCGGRGKWPQASVCPSSRLRSRWVLSRWAGAPGEGARWPVPELAQCP